MKSWIYLPILNFVSEITKFIEFFSWDITTTGFYQYLKQVIGMYLPYYDITELQESVKLAVNAFFKSKQLEYVLNILIEG